MRRGDARRNAVHNVSLVHPQAMHAVDAYHRLTHDEPSSDEELDHLKENDSEHAPSTPSAGQLRLGHSAAAQRAHVQTEEWGQSGTRRRRKKVLPKDGLLAAEQCNHLQSRNAPDAPSLVLDPKGRLLVVEPGARPGRDMHTPDAESAISLVRRRRTLAAPDAQRQPEVVATATDNATPQGLRHRTRWHPDPHVTKASYSSDAALVRAQRRDRQATIHMHQNLRTLAARRRRQHPPLATAVLPPVAGASPSPTKQQQRTADDWMPRHLRTMARSTTPLGKNSRTIARMTQVKSSIGLVGDNLVRLGDWRRELAAKQERRREPPGPVWSWS